MKIKKAVKAAKRLRKFCAGQKACEYCPFKDPQSEGVRWECGLMADKPLNWPLDDISRTD